MGPAGSMKRYRGPAGVPVPPAPRGLKRRKPREYAEWRALRQWGRLPPWEIDPLGYRLRGVREEAGLTQAELAARLGVTQQAVSRAEQWSANPTVALVARWAEACGGDLEIRLWIDRPSPSGRVDSPQAHG